jgi:hypothetical protein
MSIDNSMIVHEKNLFDKIFVHTNNITQQQKTNETTTKTNYTNHKYMNIFKYNTNIMIFHI